MTTTTVWNIAQLERHTNDGIVTTVHYTVDASDSVYRSSAYGSVGLEAPEGNAIPFASLTPEIVISWVKEKLGGEYEWFVKYCGWRQCGVEQHHRGF